MSSKHHIADEAEDPPASKRHAIAEPDPPLIEIAPRGDIIFVLDDAKMKLKVSSTVLTLASPAFSAMFSPDRPWTGARGLSEHRPKKIPLPYDDPEAMKLICELLHHQHDPDKSGHPGLALIRELALLASQYLLEKALRCHFDRWLKVEIRKARESSYRDHADLLAIAYLLDSPELFALVSKDLIFFLERPSLAVGTMDETLPSKVLLDLEIKRSVLKERMKDAIHETVTLWLTRRSTFSHGCTLGNCTMLYYHNLTYPTRRAFYQAGDTIIALWNAWSDDESCLPRGLEYFWGTFRDIHDACLGESVICENCKRVALSVFQEAVMDDVRDFLQDELLNFDGLCLDCIGHDREDACRLPHPHGLGSDWFRL